MTVYRFTECLNDLFDAFFLADPLVLQHFQRENGLPVNLLSEFTQNDSGDRVVEEGALVPLCGIENFPYQVNFHLAGSVPDLLQANSDLQIRQGGYRLRVESGRVALFTVPYLRDFGEHVMERLAQRRERGNPEISLANGWYGVEILAGRSWKTEMFRGQATSYLEPMLEFLLTWSKQAPVFTADIQIPFTVDDKPQ